MGLSQEGFPGPFSPSHHCCPVAATNHQWVPGVEALNHAARERESGLGCVRVCAWAFKRAGLGTLECGVAATGAGGPAVKEVLGKWVWAGVPLGHIIV